MPKVPVPPRDYKEWLWDILRKGITGLTPEQHVTKIGFWEDVDGNIKYIKFYDDNNLVFTLEFSNAGAAGAETWSITRS